jgi:hypothetical protein
MYGYYRPASDFIFVLQNKTVVGLCLKWRTHGITINIHHNLKFETCCQCNINTLMKCK